MNPLSEIIDTNGANVLGHECPECFRIGGKHFALYSANHGGARPGAGRKPAPYKTKTISFRVREEWAEEIKQIVKDKIAEKSNI